MGKRKDETNSIEYKFFKFKDEMLNMLDEGSDLTTIYKKYEVNNRFQPVLNNLFRENYGFSLKEYRQSYLRKKKEAKKKVIEDRNDKEFKFRSALKDVILAVMDGDSINQTLIEHRIFSYERKEFVNLVKDTFGYELIDIKRNPALLNREEVVKVCDEIKDSLTPFSKSSDKCESPNDEVKVAKARLQYIVNKWERIREQQSALIQEAELLINKYGLEIPAHQVYKPDQFEWGESEPDLKRALHGYSEANRITILDEAAMSRKKHRQN